MNAKRSINAIETAMQRIRKNLMPKRKRKSKLRMISLQAKKRWMRKHLKKTKAALNQFYIVAPWMNSSKIIIEIDKIRTSQVHDSDTSNLRWKVYSNENERDENVTAATMNFNWNKKRRLKNADTALTHHDELKNLIMIVEKLINHCERTTDARNKVYKVYSDNQISLKMIHVMSSMFDQKRLQRI